jgi:hypothetical protein
MNISMDHIFESYIEKGKFVGIIDMTNISLFSRRPSIRVVLDAVALIKYAYPNRLASLYIVNSGYLFSTLWNIIKPTLSQTSMGKVVFISSIDEARLILPEELGIEGLEIAYGGLVSDGINVTEYFKLGDVFF